MSQVTNAQRKKVDKMPVLVVEDNADHWLLIRSVLKECFPEITPIWVADPRQALVYLEACSSETHQLPKLILQDLYLPRREDGWALLKAIKENPAYQAIPVCLLSQSKDQADIETCYQLGGSSFIRKPITFHQWKATFYTFRAYWWQLVSLPPDSFSTTAGNK
ncbi:response regulator [Spirosoma jeollabukense]